MTLISLIVIGLLGGLITSISPCVLPVLPVILAVGVPKTADPANPTAQAKPAKRRARRSLRPYGVIFGLVLSFSLATLFGTVVLSALHMPQDFLRDAGIVVLVVVGLGLIVPQVGDALERPFSHLPKRAVNATGNGVGVGLGLGLLYAPCAGPVLATIAVVGANHRVGFSAIVLTFAFAIGAGIPLLVLALAGEQLSHRLTALRTHARELRVAGGVLMIVVALAIGFNLTDALQRHVPGYTTALQNHVESNATAARKLQALTGEGTGGASSQCAEGGAVLQNCGAAPEITGITGWLNTPNNTPLSLAGLHGKVVLIDFWTYSCINCQRTLPHVESWYKAYHDAGLDVIGVHTPEFSFEHVTSNIVSAAHSLGVKYPIAIDNNYGTWDAYENQYWPAEYLIDATGNIRHVTFGEGDYSATEQLIRQLLTTANPSAVLPMPTNVADTTPTEQQTPESYLGYSEQQNLTDGPLSHDIAKTYTFPAQLEPDTFGLSGTWTDTSESANAGANAKLELSYQADDVYLVLGGTGTITVQINGVTTSTVQVSGTPRLYTLVHNGGDQRALLTLDVSPGVQAYDFTFG
jgi:cytochrome c biogenesis protein CcdA/thiol-disulfide isomerase/thioredoxin